MSQDTQDGDESRSPRRESIDLTAIGAPYKVLGDLSDPNDAIGVLGRNTATTGVTRGVEGRADSPAGYGLYTPDRAKIGGTLAVSSLGTFDSSVLKLVVDSENALRLQPVSDPGGGPNVLAGHPTNTIVSGVAQATIAGGGFNDGTTGGTQPNEIYDNGCTIGGGRGNVAGRDDGTTSSSEGMNATVGGGKGNTAKGQQSTIGGGGAHVANSFAATIAGGNACRSTADGATVGGGLENHATGNSATVGGGVNNRATGKAATIAGGNANKASGTNSFATGINNTADGADSVAMGREADANGKDGAFVRGDATSTAVTATATNSLVVQAGGSATSGTAVEIYSQSDGSAGVRLDRASGSWSSLSAGTAKTAVDPVDGPAVLDGLRDIDISTWRYDGQAEDVRHMGPMAEDFADAFGLGTADDHIANVDADGVALAAIQGLAERFEEATTDLRARIEARDARIVELAAEADEVRAENEQLRARVETLEDRFASLEASLASPAATDD